MMEQQLPASDEVIGTIYKLNVNVSDPMVATQRRSKMKL
jgi:hypothetical protein